MWNALKLSYDQCLFRGGYLAREILLEYQQIAQYGCCKTCRSVLDDEIDCFVRSCKIGNVEKKSISVRMKLSSFRNSRIQFRLLGITFFEKESPNICLELADFLGMQLPAAYI